MTDIRKLSTVEFTHQQKLNFISFMPILFTELASVRSRVQVLSALGRPVIYMFSITDEATGKTHYCVESINASEQLISPDTLKAHLYQEWDEGEFSPDDDFRKTVSQKGISKVDKVCELIRNPDLSSSPTEVFLATLDSESGISGIRLGDYCTKITDSLVSEFLSNPHREISQIDDLMCHDIVLVLEYMRGRICELNESIKMVPKFWVPWSTQVLYVGNLRMKQGECKSEIKVLPVTNDMLK